MFSYPIVPRVAGISDLGSYTLLEFLQFEHVSHRE